MVSETVPWLWGKIGEFLATTAAPACMIPVIIHLVYVTVAAALLVALSVVALVFHMVLHLYYLGLCMHEQLCAAVECTSCSAASRRECRRKVNGCLKANKH